jgi:ATP phosphoribosyltransferase
MSRKVAKMALVAESTTTLLVPKNRGLAAQVARALERRPSGVYVKSVVRGEDVPYLSNELARSGMRVVGYTGDDLVDEWLAAGNEFNRCLYRSRIPWLEPAAIYGAPALCLIGRTQPGLAAELGRVAVCARYLRLAERFLATSFEKAAYELVPIQGALETVLLNGVADAIIDVVLTGRTIAAAGLRVHQVISTSDLAVLESNP